MKTSKPFQASHTVFIIENITYQIWTIQPPKLAKVYVHC